MDTIFIYANKPAYPLSMRYLNEEWVVVRTEIHAPADKTIMVFYVVPKSEYKESI